MVYFNFADNSYNLYVDKISQNFEDTEKRLVIRIFKNISPKVNKRIKKMEDGIKQYKDLLD